MRGIETQVRKIRRQIFAEVSRIGFESDDESLIHDIEAIPYKIVTEDGRSTVTVFTVPVRLPRNVSALPWECVCVRQTNRST